MSGSTVRRAVRVHEELLEQLSMCGCRVLERRVGRFVVAIVAPDTDLFPDMTPEESAALSNALTEIGTTLATEGVVN